ncbi:MAG: lysophospholipid acyltransferase family protein [Gemmataceae bacterium]|nr:lysophospholipid acyltransferase family protein [Gemmataceae bacterium]
MKIRSRRKIAAAGYLATRMTRYLFHTLRIHYSPLGPNCSPSVLGRSERLIYCIWHENLLLPAMTFGCPEIAVLISRHADGKLLGTLIHSLGMSTVEGSTTRGGIEAVRLLTHEQTPWRHLAVTPDGPRGPRRVLQQGLVYIASRTGMKIVPVGVGYRRPWRFNSWDRFALPKPFSLAVCVTAEPITVPRSLRAADLEPHRLVIQAEMDRVNALAEDWAKTGRPPAPFVRPVRRRAS